MRNIKILIVTFLIAVGAAFAVPNIVAAIENDSEEKFGIDISAIDARITESLIKIEDKGSMVASWYGPKFHGRLTANGEWYDQMGYTAAHKTLPFGTILRLTNPENGKSVIVRINDRGPYINGRDIDLSKGAAIALGSLNNGVIKVNVQKIYSDESLMPVDGKI